MDVHRQGDLILLADDATARLKRWAGVALFLVFAALAAKGAATVGWWMWGFAIFFGVLGVALLIAPTARTEVDGKAREIRVFRRWPWGGDKARVVGFAEVEKVEIDTDDLEDGSRTYKLALRLRSGRPLLLTTAGTGSEWHALVTQRLLREVILGATGAGPAR